MKHQGNIFPWNEFVMDHPPTRKFDGFELLYKPRQFRRWIIVFYFYRHNESLFSKVFSPIGNHPIPGIEMQLNSMSKVMKIQQITYRDKYLLKRILKGQKLSVTSFSGILEWKNSGISRATYPCRCLHRFRKHNPANPRRYH